MKRLIYLIPVLLLFTSCLNDKGEVCTNLDIVINHKVGGDALQYNMYNYTNAAGNLYEVTALRYYLTNFVFHNSDGSQYANNGIYYVDANDAGTTTIKITEMPAGNYNGISFKLGLTPAQNITNSLPNITVNNNMAWPDQMGGGYHFMKFEGHFTSGSGQADGFAIHLGTDVALVNIHLDQLFETKEQTTTLNLSMNLNEWFTNPTTFDLDSLSYTMGNPSGMALVAANGADVFTIE
ncbi:MAG: hypothetical protein POELPBGB_01161 [Bacteroidia bacterium]|nr:hypothetical protein [Bacteroidia bacterium]